MFRWRAVAVACLTAGSLGGCCHCPKQVPVYPTSVESDTDATRFPAAELWLAEDRTVNRTAVLNDNGQSLAWVIIHDGSVVLKRNAKNETQYRYFREDAGTYTIYLEQFVDGQYRVISNVVSYRID